MIDKSTVLLIPLENNEVPTMAKRRDVQGIWNIDGFEGSSDCEDEVFVLMSRPGSREGLMVPCSFEEADFDARQVYILGEAATFMR